MLDAIAQAVTASDYVLDRFHFPDSDKNGTTASNSAAEHGHLHELEPGVIIFKNYVGKEIDWKSISGDRLVVLVITQPGERMNTALANALQLDMACRGLTNDPPEGPTIRILGPTFSGSSEPSAARCAWSKSRLDRAPRPRRCRGAPPIAQNKRTIEHGLSDPRRRSRRLSRRPCTRRVLLPRLVSKSRPQEWSRQIAVLFEANTQYGREMGRSSGTAATSGGEPLSSSFSLPFPMNISRLRTTARPRERPAPALGLPSRFRPLPMEAGESVRPDSTVHPKTTASYVELALAGVLETMRQRGRETVALMATDPRDKLFLAQEIARHLPDVSIFTAESDSLYIHPDYSSYLRGASSCPPIRS